MKELAAHQRGKSWETPRGRVTVWTPLPRVLIVQFVGHGDPSFVEPVVTAFAHATDRGEAIHLYFDLDALRTYDSPLRTELTAAFLKRRSQLSSFPVLVRSKIVAMGASVANLALGGIITLFTNGDEFCRRLDADLGRQGNTDFSAEIVRTDRLRALG